MLENEWVTAIRKFTYFLHICLEDNELAAVLVLLVPAVDDLVAPLLHADALAVAAGELPVPAAGQLEGPPVIRDT